MLCVGLDTDIDRMPNVFPASPEGIFDFNKQIILATSAHASAFKLNFAFYEQYGSRGFEALEKTIDIIPKEKLIIADAKRGDIGNTAKAYAKSVFEHFKCDAVTLNPYMGIDTLVPYAEYEEKLLFVLALTSNKGSEDFEQLQTMGKSLYEEVIIKVASSFSSSQVGFVIGASKPEALARVRSMIKENMLLIPGIGAQGGSLKKTLLANGGMPAMINASRSIIYASQGADFAQKAALEAEKLKTEINTISKSLAAK